MEYEESFNSQWSVVNIEIWKDIEGYEGLYQVSNLGRVKSLKFNKIKILSQGISGSGYKIVSLSKENPQVNIQLQEKRWYGNILIKQGG